jgi:transposase
MRRRLCPFLQSRRMAPRVCLSSMSMTSSLAGQKLKDSYSDTGRPLIDPELLLRILLICYLYGVTSERKPVEELQMHLAWR